MKNPIFGGEITKKEYKQMLTGIRKTMKRYFLRIFLAIIGRNPFREELEKVQKDLENERTRVKDFQNLTENLRQRVSDKDKDLQDECREHRATREDLQTTLDKLQYANQALARDCMAQSMLDKTNHALNDLASAMNGGDEEKVASVVEYLAWNNPMSRIAQRHLSLLRLYHSTQESVDDDNVNHE